MIEFFEIAGPKVRAPRVLQVETTPDADGNTDIEISLASGRPFTNDQWRRVGVLLRRHLRRRGVELIGKVRFE